MLPKGSLTFASHVVLRLVASLAGAAADGHHPLSITIAVQFDGHVHLLGIGDAGAPCCHQRGALCTCHRLREDGKVLHHAGALLEEDPDRQQRHASSVVLESQVKTIAGQGPETSHFRVHLHQPAPKVHLGEALVSSNGVHFEVGCLCPEGRLLGGNDRVCLVVVEVEGLLAGAGHVGEAAAVAHGEAHLGVDAVSPAPVDERGEQPVVLVGLEHVAHLVRTDGVEVLVVATDFFPLQKGAGRKGEKEGERPAMAARPAQGTAGRTIPELQRGRGMWLWAHNVMHMQKHQPGKDQKKSPPSYPSMPLPIAPS